jgi:hypothetical protein
VAGGTRKEPQVVPATAVGSGWDIVAAVYLVTFVAMMVALYVKHREVNP